MALRPNAESMGLYWAWHKFRAEQVAYRTPKGITTRKNGEGRFPDCLPPEHKACPQTILYTGSLETLCVRAFLRASVLWKLPTDVGSGVILLSIYP